MCVSLLFSVGNVLCSLDHPVSVTANIEARIIVFNIEIPITVGYPVSPLHADVGNTDGRGLIPRRPTCFTTEYV